MAAVSGDIDGIAGRCRPMAEMIRGMLIISDTFLSSRQAIAK